MTKTRTGMASWGILRLFSTSVCLMAADMPVLSHVQVCRAWASAFMAGEVFGAGVYVAVEGVYPVCQFDKGFAAVFE